MHRRPISGFGEHGAKPAADAVSRNLYCAFEGSGGGILISEAFRLGGEGKFPNGALARPTTRKMAPIPVESSNSE